MLFFLEQVDDYLLENKAKILKNYQILIKNPDYNDACRFSTGSKLKVLNRFKLAESILGNLD